MHFFCLVIGVTNCPILFVLILRACTHVCVCVCVHECMLDRDTSTQTETLKFWTEQPFFLLKIFSKQLFDNAIGMKPVLGKLSSYIGNDFVTATHIHLYSCCCFLFFVFLKWFHLHGMLEALKSNRPWLWSQLCPSLGFLWTF